MRSERSEVTNGHNGGWCSSGVVVEVVVIVVGAPCSAVHCSSALGLSACNAIQTMIGVKGGGSGAGDWHRCR